MAWEENLPFERGQTLFGLGAGGSVASLTPADVRTNYGHLMGRKFKVRDPDYEGRMVELMIVQYDGSGNLTADALGVDFDTTTYPNNLVFTDLAPGAATVAYPLDHKYEGKVIKDGDLCYVITGGPCEAEFDTVLNVGDPVTYNASGEIVAAQAGDNFVLGYAEDAGSTDTNATIFVMPGPGIE